MHPSDRRSIVDGFISGLAAGTVVIVWFFLVDVLAGDSLHTPRAMAEVIVGGPSGASESQLVLLYTVLHYAVFAGLGVITSWILFKLRVAPGLLLGALFGLGALNAVYYTILLVTSRNILTVLPPFHVLGANLAGGMVLMTVLHAFSRAPSRLGPALLYDNDLIARGLVTGVLGAGAVALWFLVIDIATASPFFTPAALGSVVFLGAASPEDVQVSLGVIAGYTFLHLTAFSAVGIGLTWMTERLERAPGFWLLALLSLIVVEALVLGILGVLSHWVLGRIGWWAIGVGNISAVVVMGTWLWRTHPQLRVQLGLNTLHTKI
jgi:hypothetical protein